MSSPRFLRRSALPALLATSLLIGPALAKPPQKTLALDFTAATSELVYLPPAGLAQTTPEARCSAVRLGTGRTSGGGVAPRLGRFTLGASDCIQPTSATSFAFSQGQLVLTAANGDTVNATYDGQLTYLPNPQNLPLYMLDGRLSYAGGSGRFAEASGSGYITGMLNLATGQGQFTVTSTLSH